MRLKNSMPKYKYHFNPDKTMIDTSTFEEYQKALDHMLKASKLVAGIDTLEVANKTYVIEALFISRISLTQIHYITLYLLCQALFSIFFIKPSRNTFIASIIDTAFLEILTSILCFLTKQMQHALIAVLNYVVK